MSFFNPNLKVLSGKCSLINYHRQYSSNYFVFKYFLSVLIKRHKSEVLNQNYVGNGFLLNEISTMSKRVRSKSLLKPKKLKRSASPNNKRNSIPRTCKHQSKPNFVDYSFDFLSISSNKPTKKSSQVQMNVSKESKKEESRTNWSSDEELDVVFDLQEEKKNKIYEVITVMSDDETPNKITYEKIYADKPEDKIVEIPESGRNPVAQNMNVTDIGTISNNKVVQKVDLGSENIQNSAMRQECVIKEPENNRESNVIVNDESDDEVVCLAVIDPKTKAEMKKANIEEICLSSDPESDITPVVPPLRLKIPAIPNYNHWSVDQFLERVENDCPFGTSNASPFTLQFRKQFIYPYLPVIEKKRSNVLQPLSDWDSSSSSPKHSTSDDLSLANSPKGLSPEESSNDSNTPPSLSIDNENVSSPASSSDEENRIYWKADRQSRRKGEIIYEEFTSFGNKIQTGEITVDSNTSIILKVMSYNVLAQSLLEQHRYLYKHHDRSALGWARRWSLIYNAIKEENPEILCLQEVEDTYLASHYAKLDDLGYRWIYKKRTSSYQDGVAIFYKASLFDEEDHAKVEYFQPGVSVLDRHNVGLVVRLKLKKSPKHAIVVATTHLLYNPRRSDVKLAQTQMLLAEIDRLAINKDNLKYCPVILTGDFNLKPRNGVYKLITEGQMTYKGMSRRTLNPPEDTNTVPKTLIPHRLGITDSCQHVEVLNARTAGETSPPSTTVYHSRLNKDPCKHGTLDNRFESGALSHTLSFRSVYPHVKIDGQKEASTHHEHWITVDYIFYSYEKEKEERSLQLISRLRLPTQDECARLLQFLPNFAFGSDHLPLVGKFLLKLN